MLHKETTEIIKIVDYYLNEKKGVTLEVIAKKDLENLTAIITVFVRCDR